jgi:hypothetical protein
MAGGLRPFLSGAMTDYEEREPLAERWERFRNEEEVRWPPPSSEPEDEPTEPWGIEEVEDDEPGESGDSESELLEP